MMNSLTKKQDIAVRFGSVHPSHDGHESTIEYALLSRARGVDNVTVPTAIIWS